MMEVIEWIRFLFGTLFILCGLLIFLIEMIGVFRFKYVLNRMHAARYAGNRLFTDRADDHKRL